jgi:hypothetical protein
LERLYLHNYDTALVRTLFSWRLDGGPAEALDAARIELFNLHPAAVLTVIRPSRLMTENALQTVLFYQRSVEYRQIVAKLSNLSRQASPRTRRDAHRFLHKLAGYRRAAKPAKSSKAVHPTSLP